MQDSREILSITTTVGTLESAKALARELLDQRLAACVQLEPGLTSVYRWNGEVSEEAEVRLVIKSVPELEEALASFIAQCHPYDLPQFVAATLRASASYAQWVRDEVDVQPG